PAITSMTQLAQLFSAHAGPTIVYLNFDGGTVSYTDVGNQAVTRNISSFAPRPGDSREVDIRTIINGVAKAFAPFNVEVERLYGAGNYDSESYGNTTVFIGYDPANVDSSFTPAIFEDAPGVNKGFTHRPHSDPHNLAFVDPENLDANGNAYCSDTLQKVISDVAHEVGHTFGLEHVFTGNGTG